MSNNNNNQSDDQELLQAIHSLWYYKDESKNTYVEVPKSNAPLQQNNQGQVANKNGWSLYRLNLKTLRII